MEIDKQTSVNETAIENKEVIKNAENKLVSSPPIDGNLSTVKSKVKEKKTVVRLVPVLVPVYETVDDEEDESETQEVGEVVKESENGSKLDNSSNVGNISLLSNFGGTSTGLKREEATRNFIQTQINNSGMLNLSLLTQGTHEKLEIANIKSVLAERQKSLDSDEVASIIDPFIKETGSRMLPVIKKLNVKDIKTMYLEKVYGKISSTRPSSVVQKGAMTRSSYRKPGPKSRTKIPKIPTKPDAPKVKTPTVQIPQKFECSHCEYTTMRFLSFKVHVKRHDSICTCPFCMLSFNNREDLESHMKIMHECDLGAGIKRGRGRPKKNLPLPPEPPKPIPIPSSSTGKVSYSRRIAAANAKRIVAAKKPIYVSSESDFDSPDLAFTSDEDYRPSEDDKELEKNKPKVTKKKIFNKSPKILKESRIDEVNEGETNEVVTTNEKEEFLCNQCGYSNRDFLEFMIHAAVHSSQFTCPICNLTKTTSLSLKTHLMTTHKLRAEFNENEDIILFSEDPNELPKTVQSHRYKSSFRNFTVEYHCQVCGFYSTDYPTYSDHVNSNHLKDCSCRFCSKTFGHELEMFEHMKLCDPNRIPKLGDYKCNLCEKNNLFYLDKELKRHMKVFHKLPTLKCIFCDVRSYTVKEHKKHMRDVHSYGCRRCAIILTSERELYLHRQTHEKQNYMCEECGKVFHRQAYFKDHLNFHKGIKTHKCKFCSKMFSYYTNLVSHKFSVHIKAADHLCHLCGKSFNWSYALRKHMVQHDRGEVIVEEGQPKKTRKPRKQKSPNGQVRVKKPKPEKPKRPRRVITESKYRCKICNTFYVNAWILKQHHELHRRKSSFQCNTCFLYFKNDETLKAHGELQACDNIEEDLTVPRVRKEKRATKNRLPIEMEPLIFQQQPQQLIEHEIIHAVVENTLEHPDSSGSHEGHSYVTLTQQPIMIQNSKQFLPTSISSNMNLVVPTYATNVPKYNQTVMGAPRGYSTSQNSMNSMNQRYNPIQRANYSQNNQSAIGHMINPNVVVEQIRNQYPIPTHSGYVVQMSADGTPMVVEQASLQNCFLGDAAVQYVLEESTFLSHE